MLPGIGQLIRESWRVYKTSILRMFLLVLVIIATFIVLSLLFGGLIFAIYSANQSQFTWLMIPPGIVAMISLVILSSWMNVAFIKIVLQEGKVGVKEVIKQSKPYIGKYILLGLLLFLIMLGAILPLVLPGGLLTWALSSAGLNSVLKVILIALGIIGSIAAILFIFAVGYWIMFSQYTLINENTGVKNAVKLSKKYVQQHFWGIVGRTLLAGLIVILIGIPFTILVGIFPDNAFVSILNFLYGISSTIVINPLAFIFNVQLYLAAKGPGSAPASE